jgi:hypothetical protein
MGHHRSLPVPRDDMTMTLRLGAISVAMDISASVAAHAKLLGQSADEAKKKLVGKAHARIEAGRDEPHVR